MNTSVGVEQSSQPFKQLLIEQAGRVIAKAGIDEVRLREVANQVDVPLAEAQALFASEAELVEATKHSLNDALTSTIDLHLKGLPENATAVDKLRATALSYFSFAVEDPSSFAVFTAVYASPRTGLTAEDFASRDGEADTCPIMRILFDLTKDAIKESGGTELDAYGTLLSALSIFSHLHGVTQLAAEGILRYLSPAAKSKPLVLSWIR